METIKKEKIKKILITIFTFLSIWIIFSFIGRNFEEISEVEFSLDYLSVFFCGILIFFTLFINGCYHVIILKGLNNREGSFINILAAYSNGQIIKYLPGKVLGIVSQSMRLSSSIKSAVVWEANFIQFIIANINAVIVLTAIAVYFFIESALLSLACLMFLYLVVSFLKQGYVSKVMLWFLSLFGGEKLLADYVPSKLSKKDIVQIMLLLNIEWLIYFLAWYLLVGDNSLMYSVYLASLYAGAAIIGMIVFVMPGGILVREGAFLYFGSLLSMPVNDLLIFMILMRVMYLAGDLLLFIVMEILFFYSDKVRGVSKG